MSQTYFVPIFHRFLGLKQYILVFDPTGDKSHSHWLESRAGTSGSDAHSIPGGVYQIGSSSLRLYLPIASLHLVVVSMFVIYSSYRGHGLHLLGRTCCCCYRSWICVGSHLRRTLAIRWKSYLFMLRDVVRWKEASNLSVGDTVIALNDNLLDVSSLIIVALTSLLREVVLFCWNPWNTDNSKIWCIGVTSRIRSPSKTMIRLAQSIKIRKRIEWMGAPMFDQNKTHDWN